MKAIFTFLLISLTACVAAPVSVERAELEGRRFSEADVEFVQTGVTTRADIIAKLGQPTILLAPQHALVYGLREVESTGMVWFLGTPGGAIGGLVTGESRQALLFILNCDDTVAHWGRTPVNRGKTWLQATLDWSLVEGVTLPQPRGRFSEESPASAGQALVYFYRPRDFQHYLLLGPSAERLAFGAVDFVNIYRNDQLVGQLRWKSYIAVYVSPGVHTFVISADTDDVSNPQLYLTTSFQMKLESRSTRFIDVGVEAGKGTIKPLIIERPRDEAMAVIGEFQESW
jgi:hypothetical protein